MNLIEKEGMEGYGIYWALMEYLRTQDDYIGDIEVLKSLARQLRVRLPKLKRIMENYGLFSCTETTFLSPKLVEVMKPFEDRRARIEAYKRQKQKENSLEISDVSSEKSDIVSFEVKGKGEGKGKVTTSKEEKKVDDAVVVSTPPVILAWERYVDELRHEQSWIEIMAMRSGLGVVFVNRFPEVLRHFKRHIQAVGNEKDIQSSSDAKRYFNNFNTPGSTTFQKLVDELQKPVDKGKYKYEDRDPVTGQRSYCGVPIPADAPPRPNNQAVWCDGKWVY
jgi:hypothetical protein